jgi:8-oxo-dGTP pyrophosphatase MutT (NUDIX family)
MCLDLIAGIASVVVFDSEKRRETVLVYNPGGWWEPPGGVVEGGDSLAETARTEAREETGLDIVLTDLPLAQFAGRRTGGRLRVKREGRTHPGCTRAVGLFDTDTLPELRRDRKTILDLLNDPPDWSPPGES